VANAGSGYPGPILDASLDAWQFRCELKIVGTATCIKHAALSMQKHGGGSIITISSVGGSKVEKWMAPYSTSKTGLEMLTKCAAVELAPFQIRVIRIAPGYIETGALADAVVYLSAARGKWVMGQILSVCGGMSIPQGDDFEELKRMMYGDELMDSVHAEASMERQGRS